MPDEVNFSALTWEEIEKAVQSNTGLIIPVGSTEQHGPHLPLMTDAVLANELAVAVAQESGFLVAPTVHYGYRSRPLSGGGQTFIGTTSLTGPTFIWMIRDIVREFLRHGFRRLMVLNWHFENQNFLYEGIQLALDEARSLNSPPKIVLLESPFNTLTSETMDMVFEGQFPGWPTEHAAIFETSVMLHLHPELVKWEKVVDDASERRPWYEILPIQPDLVAPSGTLWKATLASQEKGRLIWSEIVPQVREVIKMEFS